MTNLRRIWAKPIAAFILAILLFWTLWFLLWKLLTVPTVNSIAFSPDGKLLAGAGGWLTPHDGDELGGALWIWDVESGTVKQRLTGRFNQLGILRVVAFSSDGLKVVGWQSNGKEFTWDVRTGQLLHARDVPTVVLSGQVAAPLFERAPESSTRALPFISSPIGNRLPTPVDRTQRKAALSAVERILVRNTGEELLSLSADATWAATHKAEDKTQKTTILVRQLPDGKVLQELPESIGQAHPVKFSPDNQLLALQQHGGHSPSPLRLWDLRHRRLRQTLKSDVVFVTSLAFSPDSQRVAEGGGYGSVEIWDIDTGQLVHHWEAG